MSNELNSYELSRAWFDFCYENPEKIKPNHTALYFFIIEHCNRLGWKEKFGLPTTMAKEAIGIKSYNTYINTLRDIVDWKFIKMIEISKNQYSANIIALSNFNKPLGKALDKALIKHGSKQSESTSESIDSVDKQRTKNKEPITKNNIEIASAPFMFKTSLLNYGLEKQLVDDFLKIRKNKKATNTQTAYNSFILEIEKTGREKNEVFKIIVESGWSGFKKEWLNRNNGTSGPTQKQNPVNLNKQNYAAR